MKRIALILAIAAGLSTVMGSAVADEGILAPTAATYATTAPDAAAAVPVRWYRPYAGWYAPGYSGPYYTYRPYAYPAYPDGYYYYPAPYGAYRYYYPYGSRFYYSGPRISFGFGY